MSRPRFRLCIVGVLSLALGSGIGFAVAISLVAHRGSVQAHGREEARVFFRKAMSALAQGTYDPRTGSISDEAIEILRRDQRHVEGQCQLFIVDSAFDGYEGVAFFPSGHMFNVTISDTPKGYVVDYVAPKEWEE